MKEYFTFFISPELEPLYQIQFNVICRAPLFRARGYLSTVGNSLGILSPTNRVSLTVEYIMIHMKRLKIEEVYKCKILSFMYFQKKKLFFFIYFSQDKRSIETINYLHVSSNFENFDLLIKIRKFSQVNNVIFFQELFTL